MVAPTNLSFENTSAPGVPESWVATYVSQASSRANYAAKSADETASFVSASQATWDDGYFDVVFAVEMDFASASASGDFYILWWDADNYLGWVDAGGEFALVVGGTQVGTVTESWALNDVLTFTVANTTSTSTMSIAGGTPGAPLSTASTGTVPTSGRIYLLQDNTGPTESFTPQSLAWVVAPTGYETFFKGWAEFHDTVTVATTDALYGAGALAVPLDSEGFEAVTDGWDTAYSTAVIGGVQASFDAVPLTTGAESVEDFEESWNAKTAGPITFDGVGDTVDFTAHGYVNDDVIYFGLNGATALPTLLALDTAYYVVGATADDFQASATLAGAALDLAGSIGVGFVVTELGHDSVFDTVLTSPTAADYDPGGGTSETFAAGAGLGWDTGYQTAIGSPTSAMYDGASPEAFEDFEEVEARQQFTVTVATDLINATAHGLTNGDPVTFASTGALPGGVSADIVYYVISSNTNDFQVSFVAAGAAIVITDPGTGEHDIVQDETLYWTEEYT